MLPDFGTSPLQSLVIFYSSTTQNLVMRRRAKEWVLGKYQGVSGREQNL